MIMKLTGSVFGLLLALMSLESNAGDRWYKPTIVDKGQHLFQQTCAACHGPNAEATNNWKQTDADGNYPPPPLNGSAHAWHHSIPQLVRSIKKGGLDLGGIMPAFENRYTDQEILALIAYFQSKWPDKIYDIWHQNHVQ